VSYVTGYTGFFTLSAASVIGAGMNGSPLLPSLDLSGLLTDPRPVLPALEVSGQVLPGGALAVHEVDLLGMPAFGLSGEVAGGRSAQAAFSLPMLEVEANNGLTVGDMLLFDSMGLSGTIATGSVGTMDSRLPALGAAGAMADLAAASLRSAGMALPILRASADALTGGAASAAPTIDLFTLAGAAHAGNPASAAFTLPVLSLSAGMATTPVITTGVIALPLLDLSGQVSDLDLARVAAGEALVVNIKTAAVTRYESFGFNSFANFDGRQIAATSTGLYALGGDDDDGSPIQMVFTTPVSDLGSQRIKRVREAFIGYRANGAAELHVRAEEGEWHVYRLDETRLDAIYRTRVKIGKGLSGAYIQFSIRNKEGSDLSLDAIEPIVEALSTRLS
jgi:hypothetical protein